MQRFADIKQGFQQILADPRCVTKILLGGCLLINPLLLVLAPFYFSGAASSLIRWLFFAVLAFNVLSFWFPLGFTFEVLRRARTGRGTQLPEWSWSLLPLYAFEGAVKLFLASATLLLPVAVWMGLLHLVLVQGLGMDRSFLPLFISPIVWLVIPFCAVACCRWIDGGHVLDCALDYVENARTLRRGLPDYLIASAFLAGFNSIATAFYYAMPFTVIFGLCLVDTWFGPIYAETARPSPMSLKRR